MNNRYLVLGLISFLILNACNTNKEIDQHSTIITGKVFYNDSSNKLWRHRVNSVEDLKKYSKLFKGVELDVFFYPESGEFNVEHDEDSSLNLLLIDYFGAISNPQNNYFWIDIKNLSNENVEQLIKRLGFILDKYELRKNAICESWHVNPLNTMNEAGIYTSYWIPSFQYDGEISEKQNVKLNSILKNLEKCKHNAISAPYQMLPFIKDHLANCNVHLWTNGLKTEEDKNKIKEMQKYESVKVVLIDYALPF
ncbi:MAG: hypothetical protein PF487_01800 [Bacteroidales bacterium]|jgi:hypothetical protein|nr:hypothetical protein [Bacteroidales bacterium]